MSSLFYNEQNILDNYLNPSAEGPWVAHGHPHVCALDCLTDPRQVTPCDFQSLNRLSSIGTFWFRHDSPGPVSFTADHVPCTPNLTNTHFFGLPFPHAAQVFSPGVLHFGQPSSHYLSVTEEAAFTRFEETLIPHLTHAITVPENYFWKPFSPSKLVLHDTYLPQHTSLNVRDKDIPVAPTTESLNGFNQHWTLLDMIEFNGVLIDEKEVTCQWVDHGAFCNDPVKGQDLKAHVHLVHDIPFDSQPFTCLWHRCPGRPMKKSSLERHMKEQHVPVRWACPTCEKTFTRRTSLMDHFGRCPGHVQPSDRHLYQ